MRVVYNVTNEAEAGLVDLATAALRRDGVPVVVLAGERVARVRWPRGVQVLRVEDVPPAGLQGAAKLLAFAAELGEDVCFCSADTVLLDAVPVAEFMEGGGVMGVEYGGFCEPGHWLWWCGRETARVLLEGVQEGLRGGLGELVRAEGCKGAAGLVEAAAGLSAGAVAFRLAAAMGLRTKMVRAGDGVRVFLPEDFSASGEVEVPFAVHCGCPEFVAAYPRAEVAIRRAMARVLGW